MADSKGLLQEREEIVDKIDLWKLLIYQLELDEIKFNAEELEHSIAHSLEAKNIKLVKKIHKIKFSFTNVFLTLDKLL